MPGRRKTSAAVIDEPVSIESVAKEEVDEQVKPLLESAALTELPEQQAPDEDRLKELMARMLHAREKAQEARERVREINTELGDPTAPGKFKDKYQKATEDLTVARRAANLTRAELVTAMKGWHRSL